MLLVALLYLGGGAWDLWRAHRPPPELHDASVATPSAAPVRAPANAGTAPAGSFHPLQLNRASAGELDALPGIGPVLAHRIVEHRQRYGPFRSVAELRAVRGIGPSLLSRLEGRLAADSL
jgi:competence protein ComEA